MSIYYDILYRRFVKLLVLTFDVWLCHMSIVGDFIYYYFDGERKPLTVITCLSCVRYYQITYKHSSRKESEQSSEKGKTSIC